MESGELSALIRGLQFDRVVEKLGRKLEKVVKEKLERRRTVRVLTF